MAKKYAENIKVLYAKNDDEVNPIQLVVRFDYRGEGYKAECTDYVGALQSTSLYLEKDNKEVFTEKWELTKGTLTNGSIPHRLYQAMEQAFDVAYRTVWC